jgi:hypothetical protein
MALWSVQFINENFLRREGRTKDCNTAFCGCGRSRKLAENVALGWSHLWMHIEGDRSIPALSADHNKDLRLTNNEPKGQTE